MSIIDWEMVPVVVSSVPKGMGSAMGRKMILYEAELARISRRGVGTVMSSGVKAGPTQKQGVHCQC